MSETEVAKRLASKMTIIPPGSLEKARWYATFLVIPLDGAGNYSLENYYYNVKFGPFSRVTMDSIMMECARRNIDVDVTAECGTEIDWDLIDDGKDS